MLRNLILLGHLTGEPFHENQAVILADGLAGIIRQSPSAYCAFLCGLDHLLGPASDIVIAGEASDPVAWEMIQSIRQAYLPSVTLQFRHPAANVDPLDTLAPFTRTMVAVDGKTTAYVCTGRTCSRPVATTEALKELLDEKRNGTIRGS
jgi:hypothetical protein